MEENVTGPLDAYFFSAPPACEAPKFRPSREVVGCHFLATGKYVIVPSTFEPGQEAEFLLRIISERPVTTK